MYGRTLEKRFKTRQEALKYIFDNELTGYSIAPCPEGWYIFLKEEKTSLWSNTYSPKPYKNIAKQLGYPQEVLDRLDAAKTDKDATMILQWYRLSEKNLNPVKKVKKHGSK